MITGDLNQPWVISNGLARTELKGEILTFKSFVEAGNYRDAELELIWQIRSQREEWFENIIGEPSPEQRITHICRQIVRLFTEEGAGIVLKPRIYQERVLDWVLDCFGLEVSQDVAQRAHRFLEEALELVQATGIAKEEVYRLITYVFNRPVGEPVQEIGGVMVTLAALCTAQRVDMLKAGEIELARINEPEVKAKTIEKHNNKPVNSPLPQ